MSPQRAATASRPRATGSSRSQQRPPAEVRQLQRARARKAETSRGRRRGRARGAALLVFLILVIFFGVTAIKPLFQKAIRDLSLPLQYSSIIRDQAAQKHVDPALVAAVIYAETGYDARTSPAGAEGLMQIEPATAQTLAHQSGATTFHVTDLGTPAVNIAYGTYYLRQLLVNFNGDETAALAAYNGGETNVNTWIARAHAAGHSFGLADIPFPATQAYVAKVERAQKEYRAKYSAQLGYS